MTFEEALKFVDGMTEAEKSAIEVKALMPKDKDYNHSDFLFFLVLELDEQTEKPTDNIYNIMLPADRVPVYPRGEKFYFREKDGKKKLVQALEASKWNTSDYMNGKNKQRIY